MLKDKKLQTVNWELSVSFDKINKTNNKLLKAYDRIEKKSHKEKLINDLSEMFYPQKNLHEFLKSILVYTKEIVNSDYCVVYFYNKEHDCFSAIKSINFSESDKCMKYKMNEGAIGWVVENKKVLLITDISDDPRFTFKYSWSADISMLLQVPIFDRNGEVVGIISYFGNDLNLKFTSYLKQLSKMISITIQNSNLVTEIERTCFNIIKSLIKAAEMRDRYIRGHSERVMKYSLMLGKELGLSNQELKTLSYGSILHDIGKLTKIVTIADAYDAITSERAYRGALSKEEAIEELERHKGTQFDSDLLEKFIEIISDSGQNVIN